MSAEQTYTQTREKQIAIWQNMAAKYNRQAQSCRDSGAGHAEYYQD